MSRPKQRRLVVGPLVILTASLRPAGGQEPPPVGSYHDVAQVNLVNVEIVVTDKAGHRVAGLRQEDFEILEDGRVVPITNFFAAEAMRAAGTLPPGTSEQAAGEGPEPNPPPLEQRLSLVMFVDNVGISPAQRNIALRNAASLVETALKMPRVEVMVVTHGLRTRIFQPFTNSSAVALAALAGVAREPTDEEGSNSGRDFLAQVMSRTLSTLPTSGSRGARNQDFGVQDARSLLDTARGMAKEAHERARAALASMATFVSSLAGLPGRKVICYVGNGILLRPGEVFLKEWESRFGSQGIVPGFSADLEANQLSVSPEFHAMVSRANADRVTFYSIDATGGAGPMRFSAEHEVFDTDPTLGQGEAVGRSYSILYLADATGGSTIISTPQASPEVARLASDLDDFYSLAYAAPHIGDGRNHSIVVKVKREGLTLRYRRRYLDKTADERMADRSLASLLYDSGSNGLDVGVVVGDEERQKPDVFLVSVSVSVPLGKLVLLPKGETREGSISVWLADKDDEERITPPVKHVFPVSVSEAAFPGAEAQNATYVFKFLMRSGAHKLAVSVRDDLALADSTVTARFVVGKGEKRGPGVLQGMWAPSAAEEICPFQLDGPATRLAARITPAIAAER